MTKIKYVFFRGYTYQILKNATYEIDDSLGSIPCIVAEAPDLQGCFTQAENFEEARENLIDAIDLWITAGLREGEEMPIVNGCKLAFSVERQERVRDKMKVASG